jgi:phosphate:Na+ symporter
LDERFLQTPSVALERCQEVTAEMAEIAVGSLQESMIVLFSYSEKMAESIRQKEKKTDHYEDIVGSYLVKLSSHPMRAEDSAEAAKLLKLIGDFERISDYALQLLTSAQEMQNKKIVFTESARSELNVLLAAVDEILKLSLTAFLNHDLESASDVEPLDQVINRLKEELRNRHISRLQQGECSIEAGFIWSDLLTDLGRASDHCSNIAGCLLEMENHNLNLHSSLDLMREESHDFQKKYQSYRKQYSLS